MNPQLRKAELMKRKVIACIAALGLMIGHSVFAPGASAEDAQAQKESLKVLYMMMISQDLCEFDATDAQTAKLEKLTDALQEILKMSDDEAEKYYAEIEADMKKQKENAGLCEETGAWSKSYEAGLEALDK